MTPILQILDEPGVSYVKVPRGDLSEVFITVAGGYGFDPAEKSDSLAVALGNGGGAGIVSVDRFDLVGCCGDEGQGEWPVTCIHGKSTRDPHLSGAHIHTVLGAPVETVRLGPRAVGRIFEDAYARYCILGDIRPDDASLPATEQAYQAFEMMENALFAADMDFSNVARTWLYLDDLLDWYKEFNGVRDKFFRERGVFDGIVPASTGIGAANPQGTAIMAGAFAVQPKSPEVTIEPLPSPLQCAALQYGSSFSRALEVGTPDLRRLFVSGTASIYPDGKSAHIGDVDAQIDLTMQVVAAILESRGMGWGDVTRAIAYYKHAEDWTTFGKYCNAHSIPDMPVVIAHNDVCRDDLLFELEVDAIAAR